jgi:hypothetical protein
LTVSEQQAEQTSQQTGPVDGGSSVPASSDALIDTVMATLRESMEAAAIGPGPETPPKAAIEPNTETPDTQPKIEAPKVEASKLERSHEKTCKVLVMSPGRRTWHEETHASTPSAQAAPTKRRFASMVAVVTLATVAGAIGGALATAGLSHVAAAVATTSGNGALDSAIARIDADIVALKAGLEHSSKIGLSQFNKTSDRLDKMEKAQAEPAAKLAKLSEAVDKLRAAPSTVAAASPTVAAPAASAPPKDVTGTVTAPTAASALPAPAASPATPPKPEVARLPTVEGWVLRNVAYGGALIEGRNGLYEVYAGDPVPGLGRVDAIRKQDGRWVVVTTKGLVVSR